MPQPLRNKLDFFDPRRSESSLAQLSKEAVPHQETPIGYEQRQAAAIRQRRFVATTVAAALYEIV